MKPAAVPEEAERLLTVREAAALFAISTSKLYAMVSASEIPVVRLSDRDGGAIRFRLSSLKRWIDQREHGPVAPLRSV